MNRIAIDLMNLIEASIYIIDAMDGKTPTYVAINDHGCKVAGLSREDFVGKTAKEVFPGEIGEAAFRRHVQALRYGKKLSYNITLWLDGAAREVTTSLSPVLDDHGAVTRLIGISILNSDDPLDEIAKTGTRVMTDEVEQFIAIAAHDLRTPMRNVLSLTEMLLEDSADLDDEKIQLIRLLEQVATNSMAMISQLLSFAHATGAKEEFAGFEITDMCAGILATLDPLGKHNVHCGPANISADRAAFEIVLRNLMDNAFKHSGNDVVELSIMTRARHSDLVEVVLKDDGVGFADPTIAFLDSGELRIESGFGLLGIRRLIESRGGSIAAEGAETGGVVRFALPGTVQTHS